MRTLCFHEPFLGTSRMSRAIKPRVCLLMRVCMQVNKEKKEGMWNMNGLTERKRGAYFMSRQRITKAEFSFFRGFY